MKRFRFATSHLIMIGMILFGILALSMRVFKESPALMFIVFLTCLAVVGLFYYQKETYEISELEQIELVNSQAEDNLVTLLDQMPVGVIQFDPQTEKIEWFNPYAELIFADENGDIDSDFISDIIQHKKDGAVDQTLEIEDNKYAVDVDMDSGMFYFFNIAREDETQKEVSEQQPVIGIISIDNYDDIVSSMSDAEVSTINSFIANFISEFARKRDLFYRRVNMDRFYFFTDYSVLERLIDSKFDIVEQFRKEAQEQELGLTLSMGISFGQAHYSQIGQLAQKNLDLALVRGGDQVVIRENGDSKETLYFGGGSVSTVKRSRTRTRAMMTAISDKIKMADQVFVVGHKNLDMDALGSSVAMQVFASNLIDDAYTVYDQNCMNHDIGRAIDSLQKDSASHLLTLSEAMGKVSSESLLVMVDHSKLDLTLSRDFYDQFAEVIVIDHHRRAEDYPKNAVLSFIESGASSASELVTELLQFQNGKQRLTKVQASVVMAGIMLDTKNFSTRITSRTFDVASYLRTLGSDSTEIQTISALDFDEYRAVNELILRGERVLPTILLAVGADEKTYSNVVASQAADTLLNMAGIEASFVISKNTSGEIAISARSRSRINVQRIMENLGGGGHFNLAACQLSGVTTQEAQSLLLEQISDELKENEES